MKISYGILLFNELGEMLVCHVTGCPQWDIPKGGADEGEAPREAALRETQEETGVVLSASDLVDLGERAYYSGKRLHLFSVHVNSQVACVDRMVCTSTFKHPFTKKPTLEVDAFEWVSVDKLHTKCTANMCKTLRSLNLPELSSMAVGA